MMTLENIRDWLKDIIIAKHYYIGKLDNKQNESIGIYHRKVDGNPITFIGCEPTYDIKHVSILIHWNKSATESEEIAEKIFKSLRRTNNATIAETPISIQIKTPEAIYIGTDDKGVYEYVIWLDFIYNL